MTTKPASELAPGDILLWGKDGKSRLTVMAVMRHTVGGGSITLPGLPPVPLHGRDQVTAWYRDGERVEGANFDPGAILTVEAEGEAEKGAKAS